MWISAENLVDIRGVRDMHSMFFGNSQDVVVIPEARRTGVRTRGERGGGTQSGRPLDRR